MGAFIHYQAPTVTSLPPPAETAAGIMIACQSTYHDNVEQCREELQQNWRAINVL